MGGKSAEEAALRLETIGRSGELAEAEQAYEELREEVELLQEALAALAAPEGKR